MGRLQEEQPAEQSEGRPSGRPQRGGRGSGSCGWKMRISRKAQQTGPLDQKDQQNMEGANAPTVLVGRTAAPWLLRNSCVEELRQNGTLSRHKIQH